MSEVMPLFSTPVMVCDDFTQPVDNELVAKCYNYEMIVNGGGNLASINTQILDEEPFKEIKARVEHAIREYAHDVLKWSSNEIYLTQSWLNINPQGTSHHIHHHSNSILSGSYYIRGNDSTIKLHAPSYYFTNQMLTFEPEEYNLWNSTIWRLPVRDNSIVMFPSSTTHSVDINEHPDDRISIAFNTFVRGSFGSERTLNYLEL